MNGTYKKQITLSYDSERIIVLFNYCKRIVILNHLIIVNTLSTDINILDEWYIQEADNPEQAYVLQPLSAKLKNYYDL